MRLGQHAPQKGYAKVTKSTHRGKNLAQEDP